MKKVFLAAVTLISVAFVGNANAQSTDNVTVNIKLNPIHTIVVNSGQKTVNLEYTSKDDYLMGVNSGLLNKHLTIFSTGGFEIKVKTGTDFINTKESTASIQSNTVTVNAVKSSGNDLNVTANPNVELIAITDQTLIKSSNGGRDREFDVKYTGKGGDEYLNNYNKQYIETGSTVVYSASVIYTIVAD